MSYFIEVFHKMTRKTPAPRIMFNSKDSSYIVVDSKTGAPRLKNQFIQPKVGMYSVLAMGDQLDLVVRYEKTLPYTLPVSSDEDCPQVTYVMPRQDMKAGDFFTLFVEREHFMVQVVQVLLKSSSGYGSEKDSDSSSSSDDAPIAPRRQPVQSRLNRHSISAPRSSITTGNHRQDEDRLTPSPHPIYKPIKKPLPTRPDQRDSVVFCTRTPVDVGEIQNSIRADDPATSGNHGDHMRHSLVDLELAPDEVSVHPVDEFHQANPSINHDITHLDININLQTVPRPPLTNIQPPRRENPQPPTQRKFLDASKATSEKEKVRKRPATACKNVPLSGKTASKSSCKPPAVIIEHHDVRQEYLSSAIKKAHDETNRQPLRSSPPLRELRNIGKDETWTMEDSTSNPTTPSVDSCLSDVIKPKRTVPLDPSQRRPSMLPESDIQGLDRDYVIYLAPKRMWVSQQDSGRLCLHKCELHA